MSEATRQRPPSLGNPRLIFAYAGAMWTREPQREFLLVDHVTTIGSAPDADLRLMGLQHRHAEIRHDTSDDYLYVPLWASSSSRVHGRPDDWAVLRTGTRIDIGSWTVSFHREEFADGTAPNGSVSGQRFARMRDEARLAQDDG